MAKKSDKKEEKPKGLLRGVPFGSALDVVDSVGSFLIKFMAQRYEVEKRVQHFKEDAKEKVEELKEEAIKTGYAVKKAFFRAIVEAILLTTGLLALIFGTILVISDLVPMKWVLLGYGVIITAFIVFKMKTEA
ncbi:MAG: hypothetical protein V1744_05210 [Candidatus Altiarchaeota archaeon]